MTSTGQSGGLELKSLFGGRTFLGPDYVELTRGGQTRRVQKMELAGFRMNVGRYGVAYYKLFFTDVTAKPIAFTVPSNKRAQAQLHWRGSRISMPPTIRPRSKR